MKIALAQLSPIVGAFESNFKLIKKAYERACKDQARLLLTSELGICGYPLQDLLDRPEIYDRCEETLSKLKVLTEGKKCALIVGHVVKNPEEAGRPALNCASVLENGETVFQQYKTLLPTYDVFDEARYFEPAQEIKLWDCDQYKVGIAICEDLWAEENTLGRLQLYKRNPAQELEKLKPDFIMSLSASPYQENKRERRELIHQNISKKMEVPLFYVNQVGATDEVLFDGCSFVVDQDGNICDRLNCFESDYQTYNLSDLQKNENLKAEDEMEVLINALTVGIRDYFNRNRFKKAIVGLSGGIDSTVVAALAAKSLGEENVLGVAMPSQFSSSHSLKDAQNLAENLGIHFQVKPIKFLYSVFQRELSGTEDNLSELTLENLQARLRAVMLMTLSNENNALVLTTGNKSELAMGYCTQYGDMVGALAPIGDLYKTKVYDLARCMNKKWINCIPENCITKAPSAELKPNQKDSDSLPVYSELDPLLEAYIEKGLSIKLLEEKFSTHISKKYSIRKILSQIEKTEYKRRQASPVLKVSAKAFGVGRRVPVSKVWDD